MKKIKLLRKNAGFSQTEMAEKMKVSRPTYVAMEKGEKEMTISEVRNLAGILGVREGDLLKNEENDSQKSSMKKFKQILFNCIKFGSAEDGKITKTKLAKLIYLCDFAHYYYELEPMTNFEYRKFAQGPVTMEFFATIDEDPNLAVEIKGRAQMISLVEEPATSELDKKELELLKEICKKWLNHNTAEIVDYTHKQFPWAMCRDNEVIPYSLIHTQEPGNVY